MTVELDRSDSNKEGRFTFDRVFAPETSQTEVYKYVGLPMVEGIMHGYNTTIFTYGQTGSGKTHTMMGDVKSDEDRGALCLHVCMNTICLFVSCWSLCWVSESFKVALFCPVLAVWLQGLSRGW